MTVPENLEDILLNGLELEALHEREAYLERACAGQPKLRQEIDRLLAAYSGMGDFLQMPPTAVVQAGQRAAQADASAAVLSRLAPSQRPAALGRLGHYDILEVVGSGGFGVVLKAFDDMLRRIVAIKVMSPSLAASTRARERFVREARAAAAVDHDNVVAIFAVEESDFFPYFVMQHVAGISLAQRVEQSGPLSPDEVVRIGVEMAEGLAAAHAEGLVHRDIKPANILLEAQTARVKITDFGLARAVKTDQPPEQHDVTMAGVDPSPDSDDAALSLAGTIAGTPSYMSPEQARGEPVDPRSDLFSLGSVLYFLCTGRAPFPGATTADVLRRVCEASPQPIQEANPQIPDWLIEIVNRLLAKDPVERFPSATEVAAILSRQAEQLRQPEQPRFPQAAKQRSTRWRPWVPALVAALLVLVFECFWAALMLPDLVRHGLNRDDAGSANRNSKSVPSPMVKSPEQQRPAEPFVLLGWGRGTLGRGFNTLPEAVAAARDGDVLEIRGNGPFVLSDAIPVGQSALVIRAAPGYWPVIQFAPRIPYDTALFEASDRLVLEGLELQMIFDRLPDFPTSGYRDPSLVLPHVPCRLFLANCRFLVSPHGFAVDCPQADSIDVRNCQFACREHAGAIGPWFIGDLQLQNNVIAMQDALRLTRGSVYDTEFRAAGNTFVSSRAIHLINPDRLSAQASDDKVWTIELEDNVFQSDGLLSYYPGTLEPPQAIESLRTLVQWQERRNVYGEGMRYASLWLKVSGVWQHVPVAGDPATPQQWSTWWDLPVTSSDQGALRFARAGLRAYESEDSLALLPADFRLHETSAGYRAGPGGKDVGANVNLVGPGEPYERWKQTPNYQQWLKDSGQRGVVPEPAAGSQQPEKSCEK